MTAHAVGTGDGELRALDEPATVRFTVTGRPLALRWRGTIWQVIGEPAPRPGASGIGPGTASVRTRSTTSPAWLFAAQTGPASPVLEFGIGFDPRRDEWRLLSVGGAGS